METFDTNTIIGMSVTGVIVMIICFLVNKLINTPLEEYYSDHKE